MQPRRSGRAILIAVAKLVLVAVVVYFVVQRFAANWDELTAYSWQIRPLWLAFSIIVHVVALAGMALVWSLIIKGFGHRLSLAQAFKIAYIANLGRYIPGKIWPVLGMMYLAKKVGVKQEEAMASWGIAQLFAIPSSLIVAVVAVALHPTMITGQLGSLLTTGLYLIAGVIVLLSLAMVVLPNRSLALFNVLLKVIKRPPIVFRLGVSTAIQIYIGYAICWGLFGAGFWLLLRAITADPATPFAVGVGAFVLAYQIGYLAIFAPGGLGVREFVLTAILTPYLGGIAVGTAVAARIWNMVAEIIVALVALAIPLDPNEPQSPSTDIGE